MTPFETEMQDRARERIFEVVLLELLRADLKSGAQIDADAMINTAREFANRSYPKQNA